MDEVVKLLIDIIEDVTAREDEIDDAIIDLRYYPNDDRAEQALLRIAKDPNQYFIFIDGAGESLFDIWLARDKFNVENYKLLQPLAQDVIKNSIIRYKPEWLNLIPR